MDYKKPKRAIYKLMKARMGLNKKFMLMPRAHNKIPKGYFEFQRTEGNQAIYTGLYYLNKGKALLVFEAEAEANAYKKFRPKFVNLINNELLP